MAELTAEQQLGRTRTRLSHLSMAADDIGNQLFEEHGAPAARLVWKLAEQMRAIRDGDLDSAAKEGQK